MVEKNKSEITIPQNKYDLMELKSQACDVMAQIIRLDEQKKVLTVKKNELFGRINMRLKGVD